MSYEYIPLPTEPPVELKAFWWDISRGKTECLQGEEPTLVALGRKYNLLSTDLSALVVSPSVHFGQHEGQAFCIFSLDPIRLIVWPSKFLFVHQGEENREMVKKFAEKVFLNLRANNPNAAGGEEPSNIAARRSIDFLCSGYYVILHLLFSMYFDVQVQQLVDRASSSSACLPTSYDTHELAHDTHELMSNIRKILSIVVPISMDTEIMASILVHEDVTSQHVSMVHIAFSMFSRDMESAAKKLENILFDIERVERQIAKDSHLISLSQLWICGLQAWLSFLSAFLYLYKGLTQQEKIFGFVTFTVGFLLLIYFSLRSCLH